MHFRGLFIDLKKSFVVVDRDILMYKLEHYDIGGIAGSWFWSYLNKKDQTIKEGPYDSKNEVSSFGVPQGSVLGLPFLYTPISVKVASERNGAWCMIHVSGSPRCIINCSKSCKLCARNEPRNLESKRTVGYET